MNGRDRPRFAARIDVYSPTGSSAKRQVGTLAAVAVLLIPNAALAKSNRYFNAQFTVQSTAVAFGQNPSWTHDGRVLSNENDNSGTEQVYASNLDGSNMSCLTCGQPGPNGFPQERPTKGDWILFCSWRGEAVTLGKPCLGGVGSDLYVMRPDGSQVTRLTSVDTGSDPQDNYHPYWSPDGKRLVWTHVTYQLPDHGGTQWEITVADFVQDQTGPFGVKTSGVASSSLQPLTSSPRIAAAAALPPQLTASVPLLTAALSSLANQLQGLSQGAGCCKAAP
jgi:Tol biopolymer transport system component